MARKKDLRTFRMDDMPWFAVKATYKSLGTTKSLSAVIRDGLKNELKRMVLDKDLGKNLFKAYEIKEEK